jgi:hypothetical protein
MDHRIGRARFGDELNRPRETCRNPLAAAYTESGVFYGGWSPQFKELIPLVKPYL